MAEETNSIARWVRLQKLTWNSDLGSKTTSIAIESSDGAKVHEFDVSLTDLPLILSDALQLQADELPQGSHPYRLVAYDDKHVQLSELHQTIRGRCKDATSVGNEQITQARAASMNVNNASSAAALLRQENERLSARNNDHIENEAMLIDKLNEMQAANFSAQLTLEEAHRRWERQDKMLEGVTQLLVPLGTLFIEKFGPQLLKLSTPEVDAAKTALSNAVALQPEPPQPKEGEPDGLRPTSEPNHEPSPSVPEPRQEALRGSAQERVAGNGGDDSRKRRSETAKSTTSKRKRVKQ
jgi:hypothetical protein